MKNLEMLAYLDDIAHGRKMELDAHELAKEIERDLKVLNILAGLFIDRTGYDFPYYDFNGRICVDTSMTATEEEIKLVESWIDELQKDVDKIKT